MRSVGLSFAGALAALAVMAAPARAEAVTGLSFDAPGECPSESAFVAAVAARGGDFERLAGGGVARSVEISIGRSGPGFRGSLKVNAADGASAPREVHAEGCGAVVDGLAVVTAIALGGSGDAPADPPRGALAVSSPPAAPPQSEDTSLHAVTGPGTQTIRVEAGDVAFERAFAASLSGGFVVGLVPGLTLPRYDLSLSNASVVTSPDGKHYLLGNVISVRVSFLGGATLRTSNSETDVSGASWGIDLCRSLHYDTRGLVFLFCGEYTGGELTFDTHDMVAGKTISKLEGFGQAGFNFQLRYNLARHFHVGVRVGGDIAIGSPLSAERADGSEVFAPTGQLRLSGYALGGVGFQY
jgi:hypothetical protein